MKTKPVIPFAPRYWVTFNSYSDSPETKVWEVIILCRNGDYLDLAVFWEDGRYYLQTLLIDRIISIEPI